MEANKRNLAKKSKSKRSNKQTCHDNNVILTECKDICNELNDFFVKIGPTMATKITSSGTSSEKNLLNFISSSPVSFFFEPCTEFEVFRELVNLNEKKAIGIENIPIRFLKMTSEITSSLLSNLFNKCILRGSFPNRLKIAKVTPLYKSGLLIKLRTIGQFRSYHLFPKYLKKLFIPIPKNKL